MTFEQPTYDEYLKATAFARFRYKWGLVVTAIAVILLIVLVVMILLYSNELKSHPIRYTMNKFELSECYCKGVVKDYYINQTSISWVENPFIMP